MLVDIMIDSLSVLSSGFDTYLLLCLRNVHCTAVLVGAVAYLIYSVLSSMRWRSAQALPSSPAALFRRCVGGAADDGEEGGREEEMEDGEEDVLAGQQESPTSRRHWNIRDLLTVGGSALVVLLMVSGTEWKRRQSNVCAAWREGPGLVSPSSFEIADGPAAAEEKSSGESSDGCPFGSTRVSGEVNASMLIASPVDSGSFCPMCVFTDALDTSATSPQHSDENDTTQKALRASAFTREVESARLSDAAFLSLCEVLSEQLRKLRRGKASSTSLTKALRLLVNLRGLEKHFRVHIVALQQGALSLRESFAIAGKLAPVSREVAVKEQREELRVKQAAARTHVLEVLLEARLLASVLPKGEATVQQAISCEPSLLAHLEELAISEAEKDTTASVLFALGLYWSELGVASSEAPFFGSAHCIGVDVSYSTAAGSSCEWVADSGFGGTSRRVPALLAKAEALLLSGEEATADEEKRTERGAQRALRLYQHAKSLALMHHDAAAESRYLNAAEVATRNDRPRLAGHALTRLSYFLSLRGNHRQALVLTEQALTYGSDPLAEYLQATLRRSLGELRTGSEVASAEASLSNVAGHLPSKALETQRAAAERELGLWRQAAVGGGLGACFALGDVARFLLCAVCGILFDSPLPPPQAGEKQVVADVADFASIESVTASGDAR